MDVIANACISKAVLVLLDFVEACDFIAPYVGFRYFSLHRSGFRCRGWIL